MNTLADDRTLASNHVSCNRVLRLETSLLLKERANGTGVSGAPPATRPIMRPPAAHPLHALVGQTATRFPKTSANPLHHTALH